jgi:hypothetical protein
MKEVKSRKVSTFFPSRQGLIVIESYRHLTETSDQKTFYSLRGTGSILPTLRPINQFTFRKTIQPITRIFLTLLVDGRAI